MTGCLQDKETVLGHKTAAFCLIYFRHDADMNDILQIECPAYVHPRQKR